MTGLERLRELSGELHSALLSEIADQIEREHAQTVEDHERQQEIIRDLQRERDEALRAAAASRMVAAELRTLAGEWDEWGLGGQLMSLAERLEAHEAAAAHSTEVTSKTYTRDNIDARNASCDGHISEPDATFEGEKVTRDASIAIPVLAVVEEMERHCLGVEGMEDSPVARWARELREVVGWPVRGEEDARAAKWVRENGGLDPIKNRDKFASEALEWLRRLSSVTGGKRAYVDEMMAELENRLMPPGIEWPKVDGEPVDFTTGYSPSIGVLEAVEIYNNGACTVMSHDGIVSDVGDIHIAKPEPPDSWEKLEDDATLEAAAYCERKGIDVEVGEPFAEQMALDLVRRAKALAERERGDK